MRLSLKSLFPLFLLFFTLLVPACHSDAATVAKWKSFVVTEASPATIYTVPAGGTFFITGISISGGKNANYNTVVTVVAPVNDPSTPAPIFAAAAIPGTGGGLNSSLNGNALQLQLFSGASITYETINAPLFRLNIVGVEYTDDGE